MKLPETRPDNRRSNMPERPSRPPMRPCPGCGKEVIVSATTCVRCGSSVAAPDIVDGRYVVEAEIGRGGMGVVYRAHDEGLRRTVAVKLIRSHLVRDASVMEAFKREARGLASVRSCHVVQVHAFGPHDGSYFFAMEFVHGRNLQAIVEEHAKNGENVPLSRALKILESIASGLDAVHEAGLLHRDVKPENIVIEERTGRPVLIDFGLALPIDDARPGASVSGGSPAYASPEQADGGPLSPRSDIYSFGCTAYELLTGKLPFAGAKTMAALAVMRATSAFAAPSSVREGLAAADEVFRRVLAPRPEHRYETCGDFVAVLAEELGVSHDAAPPPSRAVIRGSDRPPGPIEVLIVEDDPLFAAFAARAAQLAFRGAEARVRVADGGVAALNAAQERAPDVVLLDYDMPQMNGVEVLSKLRELPGGTEARVLVLSATAGEFERWRFSVLGVSDFRSKPIKLPALLSAIDAATRDAGFRAQNARRSGS